MKLIFQFNLFIFLSISCNTNRVSFEKFETIPFIHCMYESEQRTNEISDSIRLISELQHFIDVKNCEAAINIQKVDNLLKDSDLLLTKKPVVEILLNSAYTRRDACSYWNTVVEVVLDSEIQQDSIYLYRIPEKNKYRVVLCP